MVGSKAKQGHTVLNIQIRKSDCSSSKPSIQCLHIEAHSALGLQADYSLFRKFFARVTPHISQLCKAQTAALITVESLRREAKSLRTNANYRPYFNTRRLRRQVGVLQ